MHIKIYTKSDEIPSLLPGNIQHSLLMFCALEKSLRSFPYMLVAYESGKELAHLIIIRRRGLFGMPGACSRYIIYGEGVYCDGCTCKETVYSEFLRILFEKIDLGHSYVEVKTIEDPRFAYAAFSGRGFTPVRDHRIYISLHSKPPEERLSKRYRAHIRKAVERGVSYRVAETPEEVSVALSLLKGYYKSKVRRPSPKVDIMYQLLVDETGCLRSEARLFLVESSGKMIGCSVCTYDKERAYLAYSCGLRKSYPRFYPGIVAVWAAIEDAYCRGYSHIEFLESRTLVGIRSGYKNFLLNFGGKQVSTLRWYRFGWRVLNKILRAIYV